MLIVIPVSILYMCCMVVFTFRVKPLKPKPAGKFVLSYCSIYKYFPLMLATLWIPAAIIYIATNPTMIVALLLGVIANAIITISAVIYVPSTTYIVTRDGIKRQRLFFGDVFINWSEITSVKSELGNIVIKSLHAKFSLSNGLVGLPDVAEVIKNNVHHEKRKRADKLMERLLKN